MIVLAGGGNSNARIMSLHRAASAR